MSWFYLALLAPFLYAIVNLVDDNVLRFVNKGPYFISATAGLFGALPLLSLLLHDGSVLPTNLAIMAGASGFLTVLYYYFFFKALEVEQPSVVVALFALLPATLPFLAHFILGEQLLRTQIIGFAIVLIASFGLAAVDIKKLKLSDAIGFVVVAVGLLDIISLMTKHVYDNVPFYSGYMYFSAGMGLAGLYFVLIMLHMKMGQDLLKMRKLYGRVLALVVFGELTNLGAEFSLNLAVSRGSVSLVRVIEGVQPMFVLLIAILLYPFAPTYFREAAESGRLKKFSLMAAIVIGLLVIGSSS